MTTPMTAMTSRHAAIPIANVRVLTGPPSFGWRPTLYLPDRLPASPPAHSRRDHSGRHHALALGDVLQLEPLRLGHVPPHQPDGRQPQHHHQRHRVADVADGA